MLAFHHVDPRECFPLDQRHIVNLAWDRVAAELRKCVLLCANCHREVEAKLVDGGRIAALHADRWSTIRFDSREAMTYRPL